MLLEVTRAFGRIYKMGREKLFFSIMLMISKNKVCQPESTPPNLKSLIKKA